MPGNCQIMVVTLDFDDSSWRNHTCTYVMLVYHVNLWCDFVRQIISFLSCSPLSAWHMFLLLDLSVEMGVFLWELQTNNFHRNYVQKNDSHNRIFISEIFFCKHRFRWEPECTSRLCYQPRCYMAGRYLADFVETYFIYRNLGNSCNNCHRPLFWGVVGQQCAYKKVTVKSENLHSIILQLQT